MEQVTTQMSLNVQNATQLADQMKSIQKAKLHRMVYQDPSLARELVATEASPVYNAKGEIIQAVSTTNIGV